jgi:CRP-like cAMP-binding protein
VSQAEHPDRRPVRTRGDKVPQRLVDARLGDHELVGVAEHHRVVRLLVPCSELRVLHQHQEAAAEIEEELVPPELLSAAQQAWDGACDLAGDFGVPGERGTVIDLQLTQQDLAKMIGATRETVSHCLAKLLEYGAVRRRRAPITVNLEKLRQFLDEAENSD